MYNWGIIHFILGIANVNILAPLIHLRIISFLLFQWWQNMSSRNMLLHSVWSRYIAALVYENFFFAKIRLSWDTFYRYYLYLLDIKPLQVDPNLLFYILYYHKPRSSIVLSYYVWKYLHGTTQGKEQEPVPFYFEKELRVV